MKAIVYTTKTCYLKAKITIVILGITINHFANDFRELQNRITVFIANDGGNMETDKILIKPYNISIFFFQILFTNYFYRKYN